MTRDVSRVVASAASAAVIAVLAGCADAGAPATGERVERNDSAGVPVVFSRAPAWDSATAWRLSAEPRTRIGTVAGEGAAQFVSVVSARRLADGGMLVVHQRPPDLRIFDADGAHRLTAGGAGEGPGEFRTVMGWVDRDGTLVAYDAFLGRLTRFTPDGELRDTRAVDRAIISDIDATSAPPLWRDRLGNGDLVGRPNRPDQTAGQGRQRSRFAFTRLDVETLTYDTFAVVEGPEYTRLPAGQSGGSGRALASAFTPITEAAAGDSALFVSDTRDFWIREVAPGGRIIRRFGRAWDPVPVTTEDIDAYREAALARVSEDYLPTQRQILDQMGYMDTMPAHDNRMLVDSEGALWVAHEADPESPTVTWSVFDPEGVWLGEVGVPAGLRVTDIGQVEVVGVERNDMDVEFVAVYGLEKPGG